jgi:hypothetical protein
MSMDWEEWSKRKCMHGVLHSEDCVECLKTYAQVLGDLANARIDQLEKELAEVKRKLKLALRSQKNLSP